MLERQNTMPDPALFWIRQACTSFTDKKHVSFARAEDGRLMVEELRGSVWTDCLATSVTIQGSIPASSYYAIIVSDRCANVLHAESALAVVLLMNARSTSKKIPHQDYVALTGEPGVSLVQATSRYSVSLPALPGVCAAIDTWDGNDFVTSNHSDGRGRTHFCSRRILEIAREERWTGFAFHPADLPQPLHGLWDGIDYLGEEWPPQHWYPPDPNTFAGVQDWISAFDRVGFAAGSFAHVMVREHADWSSQEAVDWLATCFDEHEPGTRRSDNAARVYWTMWSQHRELFSFDPSAVEQALNILRQLSHLSPAGLRKRYSKSG